MPIDRPNIPSTIRNLMLCLGLAMSLPVKAEPVSVHYADQLTLPNGGDLAAVGMPGVPQGGISGMDRDPVTGLWTLISDDRSEAGPARFLTARIDLAGTRIAGFTYLSVHPFLRPDGSRYPAPGTKDEAVDPEAVRLDPAGGGIIWTSEGDPKSGSPPALRRATAQGEWRGDVALPTDWRFDSTGQSGLRRNMTLEGLATLSDGSLLVMLEAPLIQDGPVATPERGALSRLTKLAADGRVLAQYAYPIDPVPARPTGDFADNGVSEILPVNDSTLLVLERAGVKAADGVFAFHIRLYVVDLTDAMDIVGTPALAGQPVRPLRKRLVLDIGKLPGVKPDNFEALGWAPPLSDGTRRLMVASDDNFRPQQDTKFLLLTVKGDGF